MSNYFSEKMRLEGPETPCHTVTCRGGDTEPFNCEEHAEYECEQPLCRRALCIDHQRQCAVCGGSFCEEHTVSVEGRYYCRRCLPGSEFSSLWQGLAELAARQMQLMEAMKSL